MRRSIAALKKAPLRSLFSFLISFYLLAAQAEPNSNAVASAHPLATNAGMAVLEEGGNAFDAAVTVAAVLAVVEPYGSGIGGGGFWLLHRATDSYSVMVDGRERAPLAATPDMYIGGDGKVIPGASMNGPLSAGIPGEIAALVHIAERYGSMSLPRLLQPAIELADKGFEVDRIYRGMARFRQPILASYPEASKQFLQDGAVPELGAVIRQPDLANTLRQVAEHGHAGFYQGQVAEHLVDAVRAAGGIWSLRDLAEYKIIERQPIVSSYKGYKLTSVALPSSGGIVISNILNTLEPYDLSKLSPTQRIHLIAEAKRRAYEDRARYMGDTDYVDVPVARLLSKSYAKDRAADISLDRASMSRPMDGVKAIEGHDTTHYSILDKAGNRVAATLSINYPFGSGFVAKGTGVLLNDEMDDFSAQPGVPNAYGLVGNSANAIAPGKRMLSSMTPSFIEGDDGVAIIGTPGGSRIITMVLLAALEMMEKQPVENWVELPRFHHQYLPDHIQFESGAFTQEQQKILREKGHSLKELNGTYGNMQAIYHDKTTGKVTAASDSRGIGSSMVQ